MTTQSLGLLNQDVKGAFDLSQNQELSLDISLSGPPQKLDNPITQVVKVKASNNKSPKTKTIESMPNIEPMSIDELKSKFQIDLEVEAEKKRAAIREEAERKVGLINNADQKALNKIDLIIGVIYQTQVLCASIDDIYKVLNKLSKTTRGVNKKPKKKVVITRNSKAGVEK